MKVQIPSLPTMTPKRIKPPAVQILVPSMRREWEIIENTPENQDAITRKTKEYDKDYRAFSIVFATIIPITVFAILVFTFLKH